MIECVVVHILCVIMFYEMNIVNVLHVSNVLCKFAPSASGDGINLTSYCNTTQHNCK